MTIPRNLSFLAEGASSTGVLGVTNGGTGLTSLTSTYIPYGNGTGAYSSNANFTWTGSQFKASNGTQGFYAYVDSGGSGIWNAALETGDGIYLSATSHYVAFYANSSEKMRVFNSGGVSIGNTTDAGASNLSVTGSLTLGSGTPLSTYLEGTWSPTLTTGSGSLTYANQGSNYIKVGHMVLAYGYINVSAISTPSGSLTIGGLPFTSTPQYAAVSLCFFSGGLTTAVGGYVNASSTDIIVTNFNSVTIGAGANIMFTAMYKST